MSTRTQNAAIKKGITKKVIEKMEANDIQVSGPSVLENLQKAAPGVSWTLPTVRNYCQELGVELGKGGGKRPYTKSDIDTIVRMKNEGSSNSEVAAAIDRTPNSLNYKVMALQKTGALPKSDRSAKVEEEAAALAAINLDDFNFEDDDIAPPEDEE